MARSTTRIDEFALPRGRSIAGRYVVQSQLGAGWEGEVYKVIELSTGLTRAAKLFFPHRNEHQRAVTRSARKLDRLRECPAVVQYHAMETIRVRAQPVTCLISEFVEGIALERFIRRYPGGRMHAFEAACMVYSLARALEQVHDAGEYHGDLHAGNVLMEKTGVVFQPHIVDFFDRGRATRIAMEDDIVDLVRILHRAVGGSARYARQGRAIKEICKGLRRGLILQQFPTAGRLRRHLETFRWEQE